MEVHPDAMEVLLTAMKVLPIVEALPRAIENYPVAIVGHPKTSLWRRERLRRMFSLLGVLILKMK